MSVINIWRYIVERYENVGILDLKEYRVEKELIENC